MNKFEQSFTQFLVLSAVLFITPFIIFKFNLFRQDYSYTGKITDGMSLAPVDLVEVKAEGGTAYTDKNGDFKIKVEHPILEPLWSGTRAARVTVNPTSDFEGQNLSVKCEPKKATLTQINFGCPWLLYPTAASVASRVLVTRIGPGTPTYDEVALRKERLWNLLADESKSLWVTKGAFLNALVTQELITVKLKTQPVSFSVSKDFKKLSQYDYFGEQVAGDLAAVNVTVNSFDGSKAAETLYFVRRENLWKYLSSENPSSMSTFNSNNNWIFKKK